MKLLTKVEFPSIPGLIGFNDKIVVLGSCFADNIGAELQKAGFDVCVNPFGTLYNPVSVSNAISRLSSGIPFSEKDCVEMGSGADLFCSFSHHTSFARQTAGEFLENANTHFKEASEFWKDATKVIITLGTVWCWSHEGEIVSNCLKRPAIEFERKKLGIKETEAVLYGIENMCRGKDLIFTVSPIRHLSDGAHANELSKSTLLLAVDDLCKANGSYYFPAYEIMLDELRDYRFYADDLVHPSQMAVSYLWERFREFALTAEDQKRACDNEKEWRASQHRPLH